MPLHSTFSARLIGVCIALAILAGSLLPLSMPPAANSDKLLHLAGYGLLSGWWCLCLPHHRLRVALVATFYGVLIECLQALTPFRSFDVLDMLANGCGALLGMGMGLAWGSRLYKKRT
ncbi:VanZ family protein [Parachitinimonas caeni]|uniref:VanZ family protein n=1 Tax=Parachitinimonas caeni TaxID=3031301 RepID=A0ABT7E084_9NEIS|nr:VanZ family protein [Parachitinimonas caeni]MDK2125696.1 VanZ family protein [Parachitinimonas caeni]